MTDKPLDCIDLPLTTRVGKHDIRLSTAAATNLSSLAPSFSMKACTNALEMLKTLPPEEEHIHNFRVGKDFLVELKHLAPVAENKSTFAGGIIGTFTGVKIILDDDLPPDVCEFCNKDSKVLYAVTLGPKA